MDTTRRRAIATTTRSYPGIAEARLDAHAAAGPRVKTMEGFQGMARLHTKTVEEMSAQKEEARENAQAADKG